MAKRKADEEQGSAEGFEACIGRLEEIVEHLEAGDLPLEEAIKLFEEGMGLGQKCASRLDDAERRITQLIERMDGAIEEHDLDASAPETPAPQPPPKRREAPKAKPAARSPAAQSSFEDGDDIPF